MSPRRWNSPGACAAWNSGVLRRKRNRANAEGKQSIWETGKHDNCGLHRMFAMGNIRIFEANTPAHHDIDRRLEDRKMVGEPGKMTLVVFTRRERRISITAALWTYTGAGAKQRARSARYLSGAKKLYVCNGTQVLLLRQRGGAWWKQKNQQQNIIWDAAHKEAESVKLCD